MDNNKAYCNLWAQFNDRQLASVYDRLPPENPQFDDVFEERECRRVSPGYRAECNTSV